MSADASGPFVKIDGREALLRSVELFLNRDNIKQIQIVFLPEALEEAKRKYGGHLSFSGVKVVSGGPKWIDQLSAAAEKISEEATHVIVHDAARPAVPYSDIDELMNVAEQHTIVSLATAVRASLVEVDEGGGALALHPPGQYMHVVTPQSFKREKFIDMAGSKSDPHASEITLLKGSGLNLRLGSGADASLVKAMINMLPKPKLKGPTSPFEEAQW
jgi:2-C-methyl-D-erythritol 4-phosphate cytidylyltransferase